MKGERRGEALELLKALLAESRTEHGKAVRLLVLELIQHRRRHQKACREGLARAKASGVRLGRPTIHLSAETLSSVAGLSVRTAAKQLGVSPNTYWRRLHGR